jgi:hypothetical protein
MTMVVFDGCPPAVVGGSAEAGELWLEAAELAAVSGWELRPEGICQGDACIPVPPAPAAELVRDGRLDLVAFARLRGQPVVHDAAADAWAFGPPRDAGTLAPTAEAPEFRLPDLAGRIHALSDYRGRKVLVLSWASW